MSFLFKNYSFVKVIYLLIRCYKTRFFIWNTNHTDRKGVDKQNTSTYTHTHQTLRERQHRKGLISMKTCDIPLFLKQPPSYFTHPSLFMRKIWIPPFFQKFHKLNSNYAHIALEITLRKSNLGQKSISFMGPSIWS